MRLSEIKGERTLEVIADLIDPIANIAEDKEASALFRKERPPKGMDAKAFVVSRLRKGLPKLLKEHKSDIVAILATLEGVSKEEYAASLTLQRLMKDCTELLTDEAFASLFISAQSGDLSGSASESIEAQNP